MKLRKSGKTPTLGKTSPSELGDLYGARRSKAKTEQAKATKQLNEIETRAKELAEQLGIKRGKQSLLVGKDHVIGVTNVPGAQKADFAKLSKLVGEAFFKKHCCSLQPDETKILALIRSKQIKLETYKKCLVAGKPSKRIYCCTRKAFEKAKDHEVEEES